MTEYKKILESLSLKSLKQFIRTYVSHIKIVMTRKKKDELIEHIMKHTDLRGDKIVLKKASFDIPQNIKQESKKDPKPEPEPETEKEKIVEKELYELNQEIIASIEDLLKLTSPFKRKDRAKKTIDKIDNIINKFKQVNINKKELDFLSDYLNNFYVQKQTDFYPTPDKCLENETINKSIISSNDILEPTAGLGSIINYIRKIKNKDDERYKITAIEYTEHMTKFLKIFSPDVKVNPDGVNDFLEYNPDIVKHDLIIINPPFTSGTDKKYYMDFLFHCLYILNRSNVNYLPDLIFISPPILNFENQYENQFLLSNILNSKMLSKKKKKEIYKKYNIKNDEEAENVFGFLYGEKISECIGFTGTGFKAQIYYIQGNNRSRNVLKKISSDTLQK